ncbi:hypothetical protein KKI21_01660 [Patescibacteria group bacterium]|nr:hypothetical protein [Patescibacteria group bacterium]
MNEVKPSFSFKYVFLFLIITVISTTVGYYIKDYLGKENNVLVVSKILSENKLNNRSDINNPVEIKYILRDEPEYKIKSYFSLTVLLEILENSSNKSIEDFDMVISSDNPNIHFVEQPTIKTIPNKILNGINVQKEESLENKHRWKIDLLNKQEKLIFEYNMYSKEYIQDLNIDIVPRKKDWTVNYENISSPYGDFKSRLFSLIAAPIIVLLGLLFLSFPLIYLLYKMKWNIDKDLRKKYNNKFWKYFLLN